MDFAELIQRAMQVRRQYAQLEETLNGRPWTKNDIAMGFVGDVGDLIKLIMAQNGIRQIPDSKAKLAHELADCLWSIIVLSQRYDVDLEQAFLETMDALEQHIATQL